MWCVEILKGKRRYSLDLVSFSGVVEIIGDLSVQSDPKVVVHARDFPCLT